MSDNITPYIIRIQTALEKGGVQGAKDELAALTAETAKAQKANEGASQSSEKLGQSVGKAAELTGSLSAAMAAGGPQAQQMGAGLRVLKALVEGSTAGIMGLATVIVGAGVSAYVTYMGKVEENKKKLAEFLAQIEANKRAQDAAGVDRMAGQYDVLRKSVDEATSATERLNQAQAASDNAEKAARMADITLREKQAQNALKKDDVIGSAKVSAKFAGERRDLETEYQIRDSERAASAKAAALSAAERKQNITEQLDIPGAKEKMKEFEDQIQKTNAALADLEGVGAPTKTVNVANEGQLRAGMYVPGKVVDKEEQARQAAILKARLVEVDKEGKPTGKGFEPEYRRAAEALAGAIDRLAKEKVETQARRIEDSAAKKIFETTRRMSPLINAEDNAADVRKVSEVTVAETAAQSARSLSRAEANRAVTASESKLRTARNSGADDNSIATLKAELEASRKARLETDRIIIDNARAQAAQANATTAAIRDIKAQQARPGSGG